MPPTAIGACLAFSVIAHIDAGAQGTLHGGVLRPTYEQLPMSLFRFIVNSTSVEALFSIPPCLEPQVAAAKEEQARQRQVVDVVALAEHGRQGDVLGRHAVAPQAQSRNTQLKTSVISFEFQALTPGAFNTVVKPFQHRILALRIRVASPFRLQRPTTRPSLVVRPKMAKGSATTMKSIMTMSAIS